MKLIVGLGNIGEEYAKTVHNAGFMVIDALAEEIGVKFNKRGFDADYLEYKTANEKFIFAKPRTYMNESGRSVKSFVSKFDIADNQIFVISDDIDLEPGKIRIRKNGSAGTHNGLKSIINQIGSQDFVRIRVGVGKQHDGQDLANFVLSNLKMTEEQKIGLEKAKEALKEIIDGIDIDKIMTKFNG